MKKISKNLLHIFAFVFLMSIVLGATTIKAETPAGTTTDTVYFGDGFFCLHPHRTQQGAYDKVKMIAVSSEEYEEYPKETLDKFAAFIMLQMDYYYSTGGENGGIVINNDDIQALIWNEVCTNSDHIKSQYHLQRGSNDESITLKEKRQKYLKYVNENKSKVEGNYTMTIWVSQDPKYQDILELRLLEKHGTPTMEKKVLDKNDTDNTEDKAIGWQDGADYDIGDEVPFQITATLSEMPNFSSYYLEFVDHMEHFTMVESEGKLDLKVTLDGKDVTDYFTVTKTTSGSTTDLHVVCENILSLGAKKSSKVVLSYSATLNEDAIVGNPGNPNEAYLVYTRSSGTADKGTTKPDRVKVFTYILTANKVEPDGVDKDGNPKTKALKGAAFKLSKKMADGTYKTVAVIGATENEDGSYTKSQEDSTIFEWKGIDDGTYKLEEVITPNGYNTMKPIEFWLKAEHDHKAEDPHLYFINSNYDGFNDSIPAEYLGFFIGDGDDDATSFDEIVPPELNIDIDGFVVMAPETLSTDIVNVSGAILPSTGGTGTKLFYILGSMFVLAAGVLLVARKRVKA